MDSPRTSEEAASSNQSSGRGLSARARRLKGTTISPIKVSELPPREDASQTQLVIPEPNELELPVIGRFHFKVEDLIILEELGSGNSGTVNVVVHKPTGYKMAVKVSQQKIRINFLNSLTVLTFPCNPFRKQDYAVEYRGICT